MAYQTLPDGTVDIIYDNGFKADADIGTILINRLFYIVRPSSTSLSQAWVGNLLSLSAGLSTVGSLLPVILQDGKVDDQIVNDIEDEVIKVLESMLSDGLISSYSQTITRQNYKVNIGISLYIDNNKYNRSFILNIKNNTWLAV